MIFRYKSLKSMIKITRFYNILIFSILLIFLSSCEALKYKRTGPGEVPINAEDRVAKNIEEGRGFRLFDNKKKGGTFDFASSNALWRASLDTIDFMPLTSANYSGGILITDWYSDDQNSNQSIKITIRFLSNEVRSESLKIIVHKRKCASAQNCKITMLENSTISNELRSTILRTAAKLEKQSKKKKK